MGKLQADVMQLVSTAFGDLNKEYFVIGATARDILGLMLGNAAKRQTSDLDITVCIDSWDDFERIKQTLINKGFRKDKKVQQRFYFDCQGNEFTLDVVPFGGIAIPNDVFSWPGEKDTELSVIGFESALKNTIEIDMEGLFSFFIPTAAGLFILKLVAWSDRSRRLVYKDAVDLDFLIRSYYLANSTREDVIPIYSMIPDGNEYQWGAAILVKDIVSIANQKDLALLRNILDSELSQKEQSKLLQNCLPKDAEDGVFDMIYTGWQYIQDTISKAIETSRV